VTAQANCRIFDSLSPFDLWWSRTCHLSLSVCLLAEDMYNSEGLCGNYNTIRSDDTVPQGLTAPDPNLFEPVTFSASYTYVD